MSEKHTKCVELWISISTFTSLVAVSLGIAIFAVGRFGMHYIKKIETYCASCKKNSAYNSSSVSRTKQNRLMLVSNCTVCGKKKLRTEQIIEQIRDRTALRNIPLIVDTLF